MTEQTTMAELAQKFGINRASISKALAGTPWIGLKPGGKERIYDTETALKAMRKWFIERRRYFADQAELLATQANNVRDELLFLKRAKDHEANETDRV